MSYDLSELKRLHEAATPGEWRVFSGGGYVSIGIDRPCDVVQKMPGSIVSAESRVKPNAVHYRLIVALRNAFPALASDLERQSAALAEADALADHFDGRHEHPLAEAYRAARAAQKESP